MPLPGNGTHTAKCRAGTREAVNENSMSEKTDGVTVLLGGKDVYVPKLDGTTEQVKVRQLPIRLFPEYLKKFDDEAATIELLCDKPAGWADGLTLEAFEQMVSLGEELNRDFFVRWVERRKARMETLAPGAQKRLNEVQDEALKSAWQNSPSGAA